MTPQENIQLLPKYIQALYTDSILYFSDEQNIKTPERKALVLNDFKLVKELLTKLEEQVNSQN